MITGKTLIDLGYKPDKWFGKALSYFSLNPNLTEKQIHSYIKSIKPVDPEIIKPFTNSIGYNINIKPENIDELNNFEQVITTMDEVMKTPTVVNGAIMPDACPAGSIGTIPVGGVVVTKNAIHPGMHSADICCSVMISNFGNIKCKDLLDSVHKNTHFGPGGRLGLTLPVSLQERIKANYFTKNFLDIAEFHLGTQGDGNHFSFVGLLQSTKQACLVTHHGSRGFGAKVFKKAKKIAEKYRQLLSPDTLKQNAWIPYDTEEGKSYWEALHIIRDWTKLNHFCIHSLVSKDLNIDIIDTFWNEHNFVFKKGDLFYHAKGATPLDNDFLPDFKHSLRLIPLNMAEPILIVKGETTESNLGFAPHGAGRNFSRTEYLARMEDSNINIKKLLQKEISHIDLRSYSGTPDLSELPSAYKDANTVKRQIKSFNLCEIEDMVLPYGTVMAGKIEYHWQKINL